jgi:hypothetical protein
MAFNHQRRTFLQKVSLAATTIFTLPISNFAASFKSEYEKNKSMSNPIIKVKPLGFQWETSDPFLFCVHHEDKFPKGNDDMGPAASLSGRHLGDDFIIKDGYRMYHGKKVPGFPGHPHRGFETITVVREGIVDHADSMGAAGRYGNGDVQWMTAGKGVQHSEMFPLINKEKENPMELFQIWLNLPKKSKMAEPHFTMFWSETIPKIILKDEQNKEVEIEVIAGSLMGKKAPAPPPNSWASDPANEVAVWNIRMEAGAKLILPKASKGVNRTIYFYEGESIGISGQSIPKYHAVELKADMDIEISNNNHKSRLLVLQGKPINEPVIQYGPFVMNTKEEIHQAFEDYHKTQFGGWPWPKPDQTHPRSEGRFALHADGRKEVKG